MRANFTDEERNKYLLSVKRDLDSKVKTLKDNFLTKPTGAESVYAYTRLIDYFIESIYKTFSEKYFDSEKIEQTKTGKKQLVGSAPSLSIIAIGGYGRGELNFNSDVDILFLYEKRADSFVDYMTGIMIPFLWDIGLEVGHSSRSINDCFSIARRDIESLTALMESRLVSGSDRVYLKFKAVLRKYLRQKGINRFLIRNIKDQTKIDRENIHSIFISEPNLKESPGGLRDIHFALWATRSAMEAGTLEELQSKNIIDKHEYDLLKKSLDFIFKARNALHVCTGKKSDILVHEIQNRLTGILGYKSDKDKSGIETFMKHYYAAAYNIHILSNALLHRSMAYGKPFKNIFNLFHLREVGKGFVQYKDELSLKNFNESAFTENPELLFDLFRYTLRLNLKLSGNLKRLIRKNVPSLKNIKWNSHELKLFLFDILKSDNASKILRAMHEVDALGLFLPEFGYNKFQIHNDFVHSHTVDVHCLETIAKLENLDDKEQELAEVSSIYQKISKPEILKLSLLLHDTGKAEGHDHIETGISYINKIIKRIGLDKSESESLRFLMENHLLMNHTAQRRDLSDGSAVREAAEKIRDIELLKLLYVHTCADIMAVSAGMWTEWKGALLWELYQKIYDYLTVDNSSNLADKEIAANCKKEILSHLNDNNIDKKFLNYYLENMPESYFVSQFPKKIAKHISLVKLLDKEVVAIDFCGHKKLNSWDLLVCTRGKAGTLSKITGVLSARYLNILSARVFSGKDDLAIDTLQIAQPERAYFDESELFPKIKKDLKNLLSDKIKISDILKSKRFDIKRGLKQDILIPTTVMVNNKIADNYTVLEIIFQDRLGSLYLLTKTLSELGINIINAKISTAGKRGLDVFYVTDLNGNKILDPEKIKIIKLSIEKKLR